MNYLQLQRKRNQMEICNLHKRELDNDGFCRDCNGKPKLSIKATHIGDLENAVKDAWDQFEKFQAEILYKRPENWQRDIEIIDNLKKQIGSIYNQIIGLQE